MIMNLHTHTHHSPDGATETVAQRIEMAKACGLQIMAVTDHCEVNRYYPAEYYHAQESKIFDYNSKGVFDGSVAETVTEQEKNPDFLLLCGTELGQIPQDVELSQKIYNDPRLDLAIGSVHELPNLPDFYYLDYSQYDVPALITAYFDEVLALAKTNCYDILGHITYALRYLPERTSYDITPHMPVIEEIYRTVIAKDKAIELNGSMLKKDPPFTDPDLKLLKLYHDMGGKYLTISTDAHHGKFLGHRMDYLEQMAKDAGFGKLTYFVKHSPVQIELA